MAAASSISKFQALMRNYYSQCQKCSEQREDELRVQPCLHVICQNCMKRALTETYKRFPWRYPPTKYKDPRRFSCPACCLPQYLHSDGVDAYPTTLPIQELTATESNGADASGEFLPTDEEESHRYLTREGDYFFHSELGSHGTNPYEGCFTRITGMAVDDSHPDPREAKVMVCDPSLSAITIMQINGKVLKTILSQDPVRDVCVRRSTTHNLIATIAERDFALAEWDQEGNRWENVFRKIDVHSDMVDNEPFGVAVDSEDRFTVSFLKADSLVQWDERPGHSFVTAIGATGKDRGEFNGPYYLAKTSHDFSVVCDAGNHRVKIHNQLTGRLVAMFGGKGAKRGELFYPQGVCVDAEDNIFVADSGNYRVQVFTDRGDYLSCPVVETWNYGENVKPTHVCVLKDGQLLVAMQGKGYCKIHVYRHRYGQYWESQAKTGGCLSCISSCCGCGHGDYEPLE